MSPDGSPDEADRSADGADDASRDAGPTAEDARPTDTTEEVPLPTGEVFLAPVPHSRFIGLMAEPVSRSIPIRRSTVAMLIGFLGFGTLTLLYPPAPKSVTTITTSNPNGLFPGIIPATTTTTHPVVVPTTTTTTTGGAGPGTTTTTTATGSPGSTSTTSSSVSSTTTSTGASTSTSSTTTSSTVAP